MERMVAEPSSICFCSFFFCVCSELRSLFRRIVTITSSVTVFAFVFCTVVIFGLAAGGVVPWMSELDTACQFSIALIAGSIMVTQSPASAIAVVAEMRAKGPFTSTMLGITVLTDIVVLLLYSLCAAVANANCSPGGDGFHIVDLAVTLGCLLSAIIYGYLFGKLIIFLIWVPRLHLEWLVLPMGWAIFYGCSEFVEYSTERWGVGINFDALLICIVAGYIVANQSRNRRKFLRFMGKCGPVIMLAFFTLTGCGLNMAVIFESLPFAIIVFLVRAATFAGGSGLGGYYTGMEKVQRNTLWVSMLTQAGVSLGIAAEVAIHFPAWGLDFQSTMVSVILINQVVGPVLCKWAIRKNGEDGMAAGGEEEDEEGHGHKRALIIGINVSSLAVAQRLLKEDWNVLFVDTDLNKTDMLQWLKYERRKKPEKTPQEIARRKALAAAKAEAKAASSFVDLNPPGLGEESKQQSPSHQTSEYHPVEEESSSSSSHLPDLGSTTTPAEEQQVQFRLLEPVDPSTESSALGVKKDPLASLKHARDAAGLRAITFDCNPHNLNAALVMLDDDALNFDLCTVLLDSLRLSRVIVEVQNPTWTGLFASMGALPVFPFSLSAHTLATIVLAGEHGHVEVVNPTKPVHVALSNIIKPDLTIEEGSKTTAAQVPPLYLRNLTPQDQSLFLDSHPDPSLPRENWWKVNEKLRVVSTAAREEYLSQIQALHVPHHIKLVNNPLATQAVEATFQGPMLMGTGGKDEDPEEEEKYQQAKREEREKAKAKKAQQQQQQQREDDDDLL